jgi:hypothetical protein
MRAHLDKGVFLLSIDTELAWGGVHDGSFRKRLPLFRETRSCIHGLLKLMERFEIRATWAIVGHLFLDKCTTADGLKHPEIVRPTYTWFSGDWFSNDPCTDFNRDLFWYGPDIVESVLSCRASQEIGCHGFSHMIIGDPGCSRDCFDSELKACRSVAESWGINLKSFVFPRNAIGHLDALAANGFSAFRGRATPWYEGMPGAVRKAGRVVESTSPFAVKTTQPALRSGMWDLPATSFYLHRDGWARYVPIGLRTAQVNATLKRAVAERAICHLWFHPFNLATDPRGLLSGLETIFRKVAGLRERGLLDNPTMGELSEHLSSLKVRRESIA